VENKLDGTTLVGQVMRCLAQVPDLMRRGRLALQETSAEPTVAEETRSQYQQMKVISRTLHGRFVEFRSSPANDNSPTACGLPLHALLQRSYTFGLMVVVILNCVLSALSPEDESLVVDSMQFSKKLIVLAEQAKIYRPLGASYMVAGLTAAYVGTTDEMIRSSVTSLLADYQSDFPWAQRSMALEELDWISRRLRLQDLNLP
jgi:hypothetical protein